MGTPRTLNYENRKGAVSIQYSDKSAPFCFPHFKKLIVCLHFAYIIDPPFNINLTTTPCDLYWMVTEK